LANCLLWGVAYASRSFLAASMSIVLREISLLPSMMHSTGSRPLRRRQYILGGFLGFNTTSQLWTTYDQLAAQGNVPRSEINRISQFFKELNRLWRQVVSVLRLPIRGRATAFSPTKSTIIAPSVRVTDLIGSRRSWANLGPRQ
jgi:hypothetical protein